MALRSALATFFLTLLAATVYLPGVTGGFAFDDYIAIVLNDALALASFNPDALLDAAFSSNSGPFGRPIAMLSFAVNRTFTGLDPAPFKLTNIAIHALNAVLLLLILRRLLPTLAPSSAARSQSVAWVVAAVWAVHPINLTSVLYVAQRMTSLASTWMLVALLAYITLRMRQLDGRYAVTPLWLAAFSCAVLAVLTKETALLLPVYILVVEIVVFRFQAAPRLRSIYYVAIVAVILACVAVIVSMPDFIFGGYAIRSFSPLERVLTEARVLMFYLNLIVVPDLSNFALFHDDITVSTSLFFPATTLLSLTGLAALVLTAGLTRRRYVAFGIAWFLGGHLLESTIYPLELVHEHRNYLPAIGIVMITIIAASELLDRQRWRNARLSAAVVTIGIIAAVTVSRASIWADPETQAVFQVTHHPASARSLYEYGRQQIERGDRIGNARLRASGLQAMERAAELAAIPTLPLAALLKTAVDDGDDVRIAAVIEKLKTAPRESVPVDLFEELVKCQAYGRCTKAPNAVRDVAAAILGLPGLSHRGRDHVTEWLAVYYMRVLGDANAAIELLQGLAARPSASHITRTRLAAALFGAGRPREAADIAKQIQRTLPWQTVFTQRPMRRRLRHIVTSAAERL